MQLFYSGANVLKTGWQLFLSIIFYIDIQRVIIHKRKLRTKHFNHKHFSLNMSRVTSTKVAIPLVEKVRQVKSSDTESSLKGTSTILSPGFKVPFFPAGLSSRTCLMKMPLITSPLLRRLPIPRPPTMLMPKDLLGSLQSSTLQKINF